jgi:hypothetical protein
MFEDFKDKIVQEKERTENDIVEKALCGKQQKVSVNHGYVKLPFSTVENFIHDVRSLYPTASQVTLIQPKVRDSEGAPFMLTRKLRQINAKCTYTSSRHSPSSFTVEACWKEVFGFAEYPFVYVKVSNCNITETE